MARTNNLSNFCTDIADAIRSKTGKTGTIKAINFDTEILSISGGETISETPMNLYISESEPVDKEGIWIKSNTTKIENYIVTDKIEHIEDDVWIEKEGINNPNLSSFHVEIVDTNIYLFGSNRLLYKYDILTNMYTELTKVPYNFDPDYSKTAVIGTDIYFFGGLGSPSGYAAYKYDTLTNSYTKLAEIPYEFTSGIAISVKNYIYLFGGSGGIKKETYKYDPKTDTYTQLANMPYSFYGKGDAVVVGNNIYIFGNNNTYSNAAYKYNTLDDTFQKLQNTPSNDSKNTLYDNTVVAVGSDIYLIGGHYDSKNFYKYDIKTNTYINLGKLPFLLGRTNIAVVFKNSIYAFPTSQVSKIQILNINFPTFDKDNSLIIEQSNTNTYKTQLINAKTTGRLLTEFNDMKTYTKENGIDTSTEIYYGTGENWIKI